MWPARRPLAFGMGQVRLAGTPAGNEEDGEASLFAEVPKVAEAGGEGLFLLASGEESMLLGVVVVVEKGRVVLTGSSK